MALSDVSFKTLWLAAAALRIILLVYGEWQDRNFVVKYTDIDYLVFTDAARHITQGESPYNRATYRYTPLLAMLLTPNIYLFRAFGKCIFVAADLMVGWLLHRILTLRGMPSKRALLYTSLWLLNPMVANISTRGNCESILGCLVLGTMYLLLIRHFYAACACFGLAVHLKIYPVVYAAPLLVLLDEKYGIPINWPNMLWTYERLRIQVLRLYLDDDEKADDVLAEDDNDRLDNLVDKSSRVLSRALRHGLMFLSPTRVTFAVVSAAVFFALGGLMYSMYEDQFLEHTYFYHVTRKDHRHNFSVWFYHIYLTFESNEAHVLSLLTFFPQMILVMASGFAFGKDIFFACFIQTFLFVTFNKVCTSQYFMWYLCLLPLVLPSTKISFRWLGLCLIVCWVVTQAAWLYSAYHLEFEGENTFFSLWLAGLAFFGSNCWIVVELINNHRFENVFGASGRIRWCWGNGEPKQQSSDSSSANHTNYERMVPPTLHHSQIH